MCFSLRQHHNCLLRAILPLWRKCHFFLFRPPRRGLVETSKVNKNPRMVQRRSRHLPMYQCTSAKVCIRPCFVFKLSGRASFDDGALPVNQRFSQRLKFLAPKHHHCPVTPGRSQFIMADNLFVSTKTPIMKKGPGNPDDDPSSWVSPQLQSRKKICTSARLKRRQASQRSESRVQP